jgi:PAS domain S-box-containing protein
MGPPPPASGNGLERFLKPIHPDDIGRVRAAIQRSRETGDVLGVDFRVVLPDGSTRWKVGRAARLRDANGQVTSLAGVVLDVTDRVRSDDELKRSEERYRVLFDNANDIIYTHDLAGNFTSINNAAERMLGYSRDDVLKLNVRDVVAPEHLETANAWSRRRSAATYPKPSTSWTSARRWPTRHARGEHTAHHAATVPSSAFRESRATLPSGSDSNGSWDSRRRWKPWASSPAASRTTSTTCSPRSSATRSSRNSTRR